MQTVPSGRRTVKSHFVCCTSGLKPTIYNALDWHQALSYTPLQSLRLGSPLAFPSSFPFYNKQLPTTLVSLLSLLPHVWFALAVNIFLPPQAGTAVAAASAGLVFGEPNDASHSDRPASPKRKSTADHDIPRTLPTFSRPGTGCEPLPPAIDDSPAYSTFHTISSSFGHYPPNASRSHRLAAVFNTPQGPRSRRQSFLRGEATALPAAEDQRDSFSSNGSWIRRLSLRPLSQHGSDRSSFGPDSPAIAMSPAYGAIPPILRPGSPSVTPLPNHRNKLVKRQPGQPYSTSTVGRRGLRSHIPSLRRPATSHQRSATAQQFQARFDPPPEDAKFSFEQPTRPPHPAVQTETTPDESKQQAVWKSFFHTRTARVVSRGSSSRTSPRSSETSSRSTGSSGSKRILAEGGNTPEVYLIRSNMIRSRSPSPTNYPKELEITLESTLATHKVYDTRNEEPEDTPSKPPRKSISMHFASPTSWISRTGSIRRAKREATGNREGGKRYVSAPATVVKDPEAEERSELEGTYSVVGPQPLNRSIGAQSPTAGETSEQFLSRTRQRNSSSLPPLSRLSSFHIDLSRVGLGSSHGRQTPTSLTPSSPHGLMSGHVRGGSAERASTMGSSDIDNKDFLSGDDTDFRSDTMFDSIRTIASGRRRTVETPLESMFDDTPPSTASNTRTKRLSVQDMLGRSFEADDDKITEEEESIPTPVRTARSSTHRLALVTGIAKMDDDAFRLGVFSPTMPYDSRDYDRPSFDDDEEDWVRDDDADRFANHLSPPSNSLGSRHGSPSFRAALGTISGNVNSDLHSDTATERPRSNVFDWSESSVNGKDDCDGNSSRPRTVHGKHELDARGGRASSRRPAALHVRSQSVPVVPDQPGNPKSTPKFGTWATGKPVSEDWDEDFDFGEEEAGHDSPGDKRADSGFAMVIPSSIQAAQPTVKAHSGQIREFSMLVNKLREDLRHARDEGLLNTHSVLWQEAQGIIALATPDDDEDSDESVPASSSSEFDFSADETTDDEQPNGRGLHQKATPTRSERATSEKPSALKSPRRHSVFSADDDIFGNWPNADDESQPEPPKTPVQQVDGTKSHDCVARSVLEAVHQQQLRSASDPTPSSGSKVHQATRLNFDTNSLRELVKRANELHSRLAELVRRENGILLTPTGTPRHQRGASPAFTQVFDNPPPASTPTRRVPQSHGNSSALSRGSIDASPSAGISQRMQVMTVN
ncbi:uncharacterized protein MKZ38_004517 [Zalerion maritima]|uniref:Uncharacterized protein n=1 Tax=Zalerion maritima TaxID=339359 RepID=A0AAD5WQX1_9PEZI|nr:uncharacterized protein MKZ38_004517 [Zalerion maritima]